jgi:hypothetical protein
MSWDELSLSLEPPKEPHLADTEPYGSGMTPEVGRGSAMRLI